MLSQDFAKLFRGRTDAWGKLEGYCVKEEVTEEHYSRHLEGSVSLGIYPLLDDVTCYFFGIDLDRFSQEEAIKITSEFHRAGIPVYPARRKSKEFHLYGFAWDKFEARKLRRALNFLLDNSPTVREVLERSGKEGLTVEAKIFPKQDELSPQTPLGNYINLPCFGGERPFIDRNGSPVPLDKFLRAIKLIPEEAIEKVLEKVPPASTPVQAQRRPSSVKKSPRHPPCIENILKGLKMGNRDEGAFALARHYLDQNYEPDEVEKILLEWDKLNDPPLGDKLIRDKVKSATKGYPFGCSSILENDVLKSLCPGKDKCPWSQPELEEPLVFFEEYPEVKPALEFIGDTAFVTTLLDASLLTKKGKYRRAKTHITVTSERSYFPCTEDHFQARGLSQTSPVMLREVRWSPAGVKDFIGGKKAVTFTEVFNDIKKQLAEYIDFAEKEAYYCISLWIIRTYFFPLFQAYPYLYFGGVRESGKTKTIEVIRLLALTPFHRAIYQPQRYFVWLRRGGRRF